MSPKEISLQILNPDSDFPAWEDIESLANAYLELEKEYEQQINYIEKVLIPTNKITIHRVLDDKSQYFENRLFIANDEITKLKEEIKELSEYKQMYQSIAGKANLKHLVESEKALQSENEKLKKSREVLRKALGFYGEEKNLVGSIAGPTGPWDYSKVDLDRGKKAREALKTANEIMEGE